MKVKNDRLASFHRELCDVLLAACDPPGKPKPEVASSDVTDFKMLYSAQLFRLPWCGRKERARAYLKRCALSRRPAERDFETNTGLRPAGHRHAGLGYSEGGPLTPQQIDALVNGIEQNWAKPVNFRGAQPPAYSAGENRGSADARRKLFLRNCFMCHGPGARVGLVTDPTIYLLSVIR